MKILGLSLKAALAVMAPWIALAPASAETLVERGAYIVNTIGACGSCHTPVSGPGQAVGAPLSGGLVFRDDGYRVYASNITPDRQTGIGGWSEKDIIRAIREGRRPDGRVLAPVMAFELYRDISDRDAKAIAAYLKSIPPVRHAVPVPEFGHDPPTGYGPRVTSVPEVPRDDKVRYGAYLAGPLGRCIECHTPSARGGKPDYANRLAAGGAAFYGPWGRVLAGNLTPDRLTGLGGFSDAQIKRMIVEGVRPNLTRVGDPMAHSHYRNLKAEDVEAIIAYLRSLPPVRHIVDK